MDIKNNTILITGGGTGIGLSLAKEFLKNNNKVIIAGRNIETLTDAKKEYPNLEIIQCDISNLDSVKLLIQKIQDKYSDLNVLINNAGIMKMWNIQKMNINIEEQKEEILTNFYGTVQLTQLLIPHLLKKKNGIILTVSSALAYVPMSAAPIYSATKAALHSYSISIRQQLEGTNIKVYELLPAAIETDMANRMEKSIGIESNSPKMSTDQLAMITIKGLKNDSFEIRPGMANSLYIIHRLFKSIAEKMLSNQSKKILLKL